MGRQGTRDDDVARPTLDHVSKHVVHILHHDVDIQVQHPVDSPSVGIDQIATDVYVPAFACRMSSWPAFSRTLGSSVAQSFGSSRSMTRGITASPCLLQSAFSAASSRSTITTRDPAANIASVLANPMPDAAPVTAATLPSNSLAIGSLSLLGAVLLAPADRIAPKGGVTPAI